VSLEFWATLASVGTFVVIAATAIAALIQLRHMRGTNQIATMARFETIEAEPDVRDSTRFILLELVDRMKDPAFRKLFEKGALQGEARRIIPAAQLYEQMGNYVHHGFIDADFVLDQYAGTINGLWDRMTAAMPYIRAAQGEHAKAAARRDVFRARSSIVIGGRRLVLDELQLDRVIIGRLARHDVVRRIDEDRRLDARIE
jgi:hypothetical protein